MAAGFSTYHLPPLVNGRRYSHELENPKPIPEEVRATVLEALHTFYTAVSLNGRTLSEASGTTAPPRSEGSTGTFMTEMTFNFSADNGCVQREPVRQRLPDTQRARKALMRKLRACLEDCRKRKVKCPLWHHALRDLLNVANSPDDEMIVEWAIKYDADSQTPTTTTPLSSRVATFAVGGDPEERDDVICQANNAFDLPCGAPMQYSSDIHETTASLLDNAEIVYPPPSTRDDTIVRAVSVPIIYSTTRDELMFSLGSRQDTAEPARYGCEFPECESILPMPEMILHFGEHLHFQRLPEPCRMVCPSCDKFYTYSNDQCLACYTPSGGLVEKLYGRYVPDAASIGLQQGNSAFLLEFPFSWPSDGQGYNWSPYPRSSSYLENMGYGYGNNDHYGASGSSGSSYYSKARSAIVQQKRTFLSSLILPKRLFRSLVRRRKYMVALLVAATVSLVLSYNEYHSIISNFHGKLIASSSRLPFAGAALASVAFGVHRIVVRAARANSIRCGWLSRCALSMFNVACGWRRPEPAGETGNELGHSRA